MLAAAVVAGMGLLHMPEDLAAAAAAAMALVREQLQVGTELLTLEVAVAGEPPTVFLIQVEVTVVQA